MNEARLDEAILLAIRRAPDSSADALAERLGLPRTNFGRHMKKRSTRPLQRLLAAGLIEESHHHRRLTQEGRKSLAER